MTHLNRGSQAYLTLIMSLIEYLHEDELWTLREYVDFLLTLRVWRRREFRLPKQVNWSSPIVIGG